MHLKISDSMHFHSQIVNHNAQEPKKSMREVFSDDFCLLSLSAVSRDAVRQKPTTLRQHYVQHYERMYVDMQ